MTTINHQTDEQTPQPAEDARAGTDLSAQEWLALRGTEVCDAGGDSIGTVDEVYTDRDTGLPEWIGIKADAGLFLADRVVAPVWNSVLRTNVVTVPYTRAQVSEANANPNEIADDVEARLYEHFGIPYSRRQSGSGLPKRQEVNPPPSDA